MNSIATMPTTGSWDDLVRLISKVGKKEHNASRLISEFMRYNNLAQQYNGNMPAGKLKLLYDLYNGHNYNFTGKPGTQYHRDLQQICQNYGLDNIKKLRSFNFIGSVIKHQIGEMRNMPWTARAFDHSRFTANAAMAEKEKQIYDYIKQTVYEPYVRMATQKIQQQYNIQDPYSLDPESQQQFQEEINKEVQESTPESIFDYMNNKYRSPYEKEGQKLLNLIEADTNIRFYHVENYKHFCISGLQAYKLSSDYRSPLIELCNPAYCTPFMKPNEMFFENGDAFRYKDVISLNEFFTLYYDKLTLDQQKNLISNFQNTIGAPSHFMKEFNNKLVTMGINEKGVWDINIESEKGQREMRNMISALSSEMYKFGTSAFMERVHLEIKLNRYLYEVLRYDKNTGKVNKYYYEEIYRQNPAEGDISVSKVKSPIVYEATALGGTSDMFIDMQPVSGQFTNIHNPWNCKLSYYGAYTSRLMGNTENTSPMAEGLSYQIRHDILKSMFDDEQKRNIGKVLMYFEKLMPGQWQPEDVAEVLKNDRLLVIDHETIGLNESLLQHIRTLDLSLASDLAVLSNEAEKAKIDGILAMGYNPNRLGNPSPYVNATTNEANINNSSLQTLDVQSLHLKVLENTLNGAFAKAPLYYKENEGRVRFLNSDFIAINTEINWEFIDLGIWGIKITNNPEDYQEIQKYKNTVIQMAISQGNITPHELGILTFSRSTAEIMTMSEKIHNRIMAQQQQEQGLKREMEQMRIEAQDRARKELLQHQKDMNLDKLLVDKYKADKNSEVLREGFDINKNMVNDQIEKERVTQEAKERIEKANRDLDEFLKLREQDMYMELEKEKNEIARLKAQAAIITAKKPAGPRKK